MNTIEHPVSEVIVSNYPRKETLPLKQRLTHLVEALSGAWVAFGIPVCLYDQGNHFLHQWIRTYPLSIHVTKIVITLTLATGLPLIWGVLKRIEAAQEWKRTKTVLIFLLLGSLMLPFRGIGLVLVILCLIKLRQAGIKVGFGVNMNRIWRQIRALDQPSQRLDSSFFAGRDKPNEVE